MTFRTFRLLERFQEVDEALHRAEGRRFADPLEVLRLRELKLAIKRRIARLARLAPSHR